MVKPFFDTDETVEQELNSADDFEDVVFGFVAELVASVKGDDAQYFKLPKTVFVRPIGACFTSIPRICNFFGGILKT